MRLIARYLTKSYSRPFQWWSEPSLAIDRISFSLEPGETLAIVGASGSGKSTLARVLAGAESVTSGAILLDDEKLDATISERYHQLVRMMFQNPSASLNPHQTIGETLDQALRLNSSLTSDERIQQIEETLADVGLLAEYSIYYPYQLTSGQKHRVALARALITNPKVIIADESLSTVDPSVRAKLINLLLRLQRERGLTYVIVSHDRELIRHIADKVMVMRGGRAVEYGDVESVFSAPKTPYTKQLLAL